MHATSNYLQLLLLRDDINRQAAASPAFAVFNKTKIKDFFSRNALRLELANDKLQRLVAKHVEHDEEGKPMKEDEKDKTVKWVYKTEEDRAAFETAYKEFMNTNITIEL